MKNFLSKLQANKLWSNLWSNLGSNEEGQDIAEYSVMLAVILVIVVGTVRLIGSNAGNVFSQVGSAIQ
jgi:Flp pilus assembly pilin Flp